MKKAMLLLTIVSLLSAGTIDTSTEKRVLSDEDIAREYIVEEYGNGNYEIDVWNDNDEEYIHFGIKKDDKPYKSVSLNRHYYERRYN